MEVLNRQKALCTCVRPNGGEGGTECGKKRDCRTAARGGCWGEERGRGVMLGTHGRAGSRLCVGGWGCGEGILKSEDCRGVIRD